VTNRLPRVTFVTDIITPYAVAVHRELARRVNLTVLFCSASGTRGLDWRFDELPFRHRVIEGLTIRRSHPDATDFYLSPRILWAIGRSRPDVVITGGFSFPSVYAALYCALRGIPLLIHSDGTSASELGLGRLQQGARRVLVPRATGAVANSEPAAERFAELGFGPERIFRALHSTEVAPLHEVARGRAYGEAGRMRVLATGRFIARKGFDRLIRAYAVARRQRPGISLTLVGSGPEDERLRSLAAELETDVAFPGFADQRELPRYYAEADAYAFPTLDDPFGIVVLEAAAAGLPILGSPHGGATGDLVVDRVTGLVRDPDDLEGMAGALVALADDPELRRELGQAAYARTLDRTPDATADGYARAVHAVKSR
jgi:glycosyltransferase involved in cell wall biosynthesis